MALQKDTLTFEKKNQSMTKPPKYARISKRPIPHPPTANPYAGASVPKTVYISTKTPFMSAVKRILKLLHQAEKRALDSSKTASQRRGLAQKTPQGKEKEKDGKGEEVFVKATGRAIEKALSVGRWFEKQEDKFGARVNTGTVLVVDDVEEDEDVKQRVVEEGGRLQKQEGETTTADTAKQDASQEGSTTTTSAVSSMPLSTPSSASASAPASSISKSASKKRKRAANAAAEAELPETRTRWVNMVEVAVSLK